MNFTLYKSHLLLKHFIIIIFICLITLKTYFAVARSFLFEIYLTKHNGFMRADSAQAVICKFV